VIVGGEIAYAGIGPHHTCVGEERYAAGRRVEDQRKGAPVDGGVVARVLVLVGPSHQHGARLTMDVPAAVEVDRQRKDVGQAIHPLADQDLTSVRS
jgi:hypothetical protein